MIISTFINNEMSFENILLYGQLVMYIFYDRGCMVDVNTPSKLEKFIFLAPTFF